MACCATHRSTQNTVSRIGVVVVHIVCTAFASELHSLLCCWERQNACLSSCTACTGRPGLLAGVSGTHLQMWMHSTWPGRRSLRVLRVTLPTMLAPLVAGMVPQPGITLPRPDLADPDGSEDGDAAEAVQPDMHGVLPLPAAESVDAVTAIVLVFGLGGVQMACERAGWSGSGRYGSSQTALHSPAAVVYTPSSGGIYAGHCSHVQALGACGQQAPLPVCSIHAQTVAVPAVTAAHPCGTCAETGW